jgi:hypothetical protein
MFDLWMVQKMGLSRWRRIQLNASVVLPFVSISWYTAVVLKLEVSPCPKHACKIFCFMAVSFESLSPVLFAKA